MTPKCPLCGSATNVKPHTEKDLFTCTKHKVMIDGDTRPGADGGDYGRYPDQRLMREEAYRERQKERNEREKKKKNMMFYR